MTVTALLFDLGGTMVNTLPRPIAAFADPTREHGPAEETGLKTAVVTNANRLNAEAMLRTAGARTTLSDFKDPMLEALLKHPIGVPS